MTELLDRAIKQSAQLRHSRATVVSTALVFLVAVCVQLLVWQNNKTDTERALAGVTFGYKTDAAVLLSGDLSAFAFGTNPPVDASVLAHPPGYSIMMAAVYAVLGTGDAMTIIQLLLSCLAPVLVFLIAFRLFDRTVAGLAGILTALSPQLAYNAAILLPDSLAVVPVLAAVYCFVCWYDGNRLRYAVGCGLLLGLGCWLRANTLLLPLAFVLLGLLIGRGKAGLKHGLTVAGVFLLTIAPVTVRNYAGFGAFVPLSLGSGVTLVEGIADFDTEGRFGLAATDEGVMRQEAAELERPDYYGSLHNPDGIARESRRVSQGFAAVRSDPIWFAGVAARRAVSMFRFERVPAIAGWREPAETSALYYANLPLRFIQMTFITAVFMPLFIFGSVLLLKDRSSRRRLTILLVVPLYFACFQSLLHTEYRYVLAVQPLMLIVSAFALTWFFRWARARVLNADGLAGSQ